MVCLEDFGVERGCGLGWGLVLVYRESEGRKGGWRCDVMGRTTGIISVEIRGGRGMSSRKRAR